MKQSAFISAISIGVMSISMAFASPQQAVSQIKTNSEQMLNILAKANGSNNAAVRQQAEAYAMPYFDFQRMTALAIGNPWRSATPEQQQALTDEFKKLLIRTYSGTMLQYKNAQVNVLSNPTVNKGGKEVVVRAQITPSGGKTVNMDFTTYQSGGKYRAYNVTIEGASLVTVYRGQFGETIKAKGIDGLIADLKAKNNR
ncbi:MAG: ABC transporter substrate-binding protein [Neisseria sp.]|uniref:MlaC/ttg2D family ABC transporter substrate-binding protein n=1 Tax=Neisseria sp. TaxID=192066 RepID=UPI0026DC2C8E|nr:ABC transporter substrate-binding protein [Neisseria sp.]MDO4641924.1 ABC transporter substrate-binding protein [Neisseria sp.]